MWQLTFRDLALAQMTGPVVSLGDLLCRVSLDLDCSASHSCSSALRVLPAVAGLGKLSRTGLAEASTSFDGSRSTATLADSVTWSLLPSLDLAVIT
jgi:hypothetical protein